MAKPKRKSAPKKAKAQERAKPSKLSRVPIPPAIQTAILLANRHACCVCQSIHVQIHHIDGDPSNNSFSNLAALCLPHHDMATMTTSLSKKLKPDQVREYKAKWEEQCANDIMALSRQRFTFFYCSYKNPPRIREAYLALDDDERRRAVDEVRKWLLKEEPRKRADSIYGLNAVPRHDDHTAQAIQSVYSGEPFPSYLPAFGGHPEDATYPANFSTQEGMAAFHLHDLWCQVVVQTIAMARGVVLVDDLYKYDTQEDFDRITGRLISFRLSVYGKGIEIPRYWAEHPTGTIQSRHVDRGIVYRVRMSLRTMYIFSDTATIGLRRGRLSGLSILQSAIVEKGEIGITLTPLLIGSGGWNLHPEKFGT